MGAARVRPRAGTVERWRWPACGRIFKGGEVKRFVTEDSFWELFPSASFGVVVAQGMKPTAEVVIEA